MQWGCLFLILMAWPDLFLIDHHQLTFFALVIMIIGNEMLLAPANAYLKNIFAVEYRYRGIAFSFCLGWISRNYTNLAIAESGKQIVAFTASSLSC